MSVNKKTLSTDVILEAKQQVIERYGTWTSHNIHLGDGLYTISEKPRGDELTARRVVQIISDVSCRPFEELRVVDLACLEGLYGIELALQGASVVAIDVREANLEKARFVKETLNLTNLELVLDDVRNLSAEKYGIFDVVLCLGILYHLDSPDVFVFLKRMFEVCTRCLIIDTQVSEIDDVSVDYGGRTYWGRYYIEHGPNESEENKKRKAWASIDNARSFWFTRASLLNVLAHTGFTSVYECHNPPEIGKSLDRVTLLAIKGERQKLVSSPLVSAAPLEDWPEHRAPRFAGANAPPPSMVMKLRSFLPAPIRKIGKKIFLSGRH